MDGDAMAAGLARRLDLHLRQDAQRPPAGAVRRALRRAVLPHGHRTVASWLAPVGAGRGSSAITACSAASTQGPGDRRVLLPHPP